MNAPVHGMSLTVRMCADLRTNLRIAAFVTGTAVLSGCSGFAGVVNTNLHSAVPPGATFTLTRDAGDAVIGAKVERFLRASLEARGFRYVESSPEVFVSYRIAVGSAGTQSVGHTTGYVRPPVVSATTVRDTRRLFTKWLNVTIGDAPAAGRKKLWEGSVEHTDLCPQIFVVAPELIVALFDGFPQERTNAEIQVRRSDERAAHLRRVFPADTNWNCSGG